MLFFALKSTVPLPPLAEREPAKLRPAPEDLRITLPVLAVIEEPPVEPSAPLASASKSPAAVVLEPTSVSAPVLLRKTPLEALAVTLSTCETSSRPPVPVPTEPFVEVTLSCPALIVAKLLLTMLFLAVRSTVPVPPLAESEPAKFKPAPDDFRTTLPAVAVIVEPALEERAPSERASKLPVAVALEPVNVRAPVLPRKMPVDALAVTFETLDTSTRVIPVPIAPLLEVKLS